MKNGKILFYSIALFFLGLGNSAFAQAGQPAWVKLGPINLSGRVTTIVYDRFNTNVVYAGTAGGGLFMSVNKGRNWQEIPLGNNAVTSVAQDDDGYVYVGTGENTYGNTAYGINNDLCQVLGGGVFKMNPINGVSLKNWIAGLSTDAAKYQFASANISFSVLATTKPKAYDKDHVWAFVNDLACLGNDLYAATNAGLKKLPAGADGNDEDDPNVWQLIAPTTATTMATHLEKSTRNDLSVAYYSAADGYQVAIKPANSPDFAVKLNRTAISQTDALGVTKIAFAPSNPDVLYAAVAPVANPGKFGIYHSNDFGNTWTLCSPPSLVAFSQPSEMAIAVSKDDPEKIYAGGDRIYEGTNANQTNYYYWIQKTTSSDGSYNYVHSGIHCIAIDYASESLSPMILVATNAGIHQSVDGAEMWTINNKGLDCLQFYSVAVSAGGTVLGGTQSNSTVMITRGDAAGSNTYGESIWKPLNNPFRFFASEGGGCEASAFQRSVPSLRQPVFVTAPYSGYAKAYSEYLTVNDQTWFTYEKMFHTGERVFEPRPFSPYITPTLLWETNKNKTIKDSMNFRIDSTTFVYGSLNRTIREGDIIPAGDSILVPSTSMGVPFFHVFDVAFDFSPTSATSHDTTIKVQNQVQSRYFAGHWSGVMMTDDAINFTKEKINTFFVFVADTTKKQKVHCMAISQDGDHLFVAVDEGTRGVLYRVDNLTKGNPKITSSMTYANEDVALNVLKTVELGSFNRNITSISVDQTDANKVLLTFGLYDVSNPNLVYSVNALDSAAVFTPVTSSGIEKVMPIYSSLMQSYDRESGRNNHIFIGTEEGVYKTEDIAANPVVWTKQTAAPSVPIFQIKQQTHAIMPEHYSTNIAGNVEEYTYVGTKSPGAIYFATYGKGIWMNTEYMSADMVSINKVEAEEKTTGTLKMYPNPTTKTSVVEFTVKGSSPVVVRAMDVNGRVIHNLELGKLNAGTHHQTLDFENSPKGIYIIQIITNNESRIGKLILQ